MTTTITDKKTAYYTGGNDYYINGGILNINAASGLVGSDGGTSSTATIGSANGEIDINIGSSVLANLSGNQTYSLYLQNTPSKNFLFNFNISGSSTKIEAAYTSSSNTTVLAARVYGGLYNPFSGYGSSITVYIYMPGNPYGYTPDQSYTLGKTTSALLGSTTTATVCYLPGTIIETPQGPVAIEDLSEGSEVYVFENGARHTDTVRWAGHKTVNANTTEEQAIRIKANALSEGVPFKDLLVTPEHCLFLNGRFVPARLLVNNRSIVIDEQKSFEIYHIETNKHSVIMADGALAESYLDTGNRHSFKTDNKVVVGGFDAPKTWENDAAAALEVSREFVEPLHAELAARAETLGFALEKAAPEFTEDAALALVTADGVALPLLRRTAQHAVFQVPSSVDRVYLTSRTVSPRDLIGPFVDDRRELGVMVSDITLFDGASTQKVTSHLTQDDVHGWEHRDEEGRRWTKGCAEITLDKRTTNTMGVLSIEIIAGGPYRANSTNETLDYLAKQAVA
ncbi:Hint domain-containing protein [Neokomagataea anthophila]|uniref:Hint domain-containing protein n=1 Tax=Neokomagataea anthophila TaxID=2826925 RepID=A0ABS5E4V3_9PROT|nr:Hint domain-containing protein [Neokomagataea anthophila]MBR0558950.1 Hint domain-containing protein [Neokomagataea anthophila]